MLGFFPIQQDLHGSPHFAVVKIQGNLLLQSHQRIGTLFFAFFSNIILEQVGRGILLVGILENPHSLQTHFFYKIDQFLKFRLGLSGKANHHRGPQVNPGHGLANFLQEFPGLPGRYASAHSFQNAVRSMLQGHIQVQTNIGSFPDQRQDLQGKLPRVGVLQTNPLGTGFRGEPVQQMSQLPLPCLIQTVVRQILRDEHQFFHPTPNQIFRLLQQVLNRNRAMVTAHQGYRAEGTWSITTLRNFQKGRMRGRTYSALSQQFLSIIHTQTA